MTLFNFTIDLCCFTLSRAMEEDLPVYIVTQCASPANINRQYLTNLLSKINSKVVASRCWPPISKYRASVRAQPCRLEMIEALYKPLEDGNDNGIIRYIRELLGLHAIMSCVMRLVSNLINCKI